MEQSKLNPIILFIWKNRKINITIASIATVLLFLLVMLFMTKYYTATTSIIPASSNFASQLGGKLGSLAGLAGLSNMGSGGQSQQMYESIIKSKKLQHRLLHTEFEFDTDDGIKKQQLLDFLEIEGKNQREILEKAYKELNGDIIFPELDNETDILFVNVTLENPFLAAKVANKIIEYLDDIVSNQINKEYDEQYAYLRKHKTVIKDSILIVENQLKDFLKNTRDLYAPENVIKELRLKRILTMQTAILAELKKQEEIFVLENIVNLKPVKVLDRAVAPYKKSRPKRALVLISFFMLMISVQFVVNYLIVTYRAFKQKFAGATE